MEPAPDSGPLIIGHRGASAHAPENTHAAFERAFADGADGIEFDVRLASDGVPYVFHDATFERTVGIYGDADRLPSTTLEKFYVGAWFNERYPRRARVDYEWGEKIPTLAQVFERYGSHLLYAEMKCEDVTRRPALARAVVELIHKHDLSSRVVVKGFALDSLREVKRLAPGNARPRSSGAVGRAVPAGRQDHRRGRGVRRRPNLAPPSLLRGATVEAARRGSKSSSGRSTPGLLRRALKLNLRAVITDYPGRMRGSLTGSARKPRRAAKRHEPRRAVTGQNFHPPAALLRTPPRRAPPPLVWRRALGLRGAAPARREMRWRASACPSKRPDEHVAPEGDCAGELDDAGALLARRATT